MEYRQPDMSKFAVFILAHGRPELTDTYDHLRGGGYTGRIVVVIDNEDSKAQDYINKYGEDNVYMFNKTWVANECDSMNNFGNKKPYCLQETNHSVLLVNLVLSRSLKWMMITTTLVIEVLVVQRKQATLT